MGAPVRILLADDEASLLRLMGVYLKRVGYSVTEAASMSETWAAFEAEPGEFSVVVLDGSMGGPPLAQLMFELNPGLRIVMASGYPVDMRALEAAAPGRVAFLLKPFPAEMLASAIKRLLGSQEEKI